jgi:amidase
MKRRAFIHQSTLAGVLASFPFLSGFRLEASGNDEGGDERGTFELAETTITAVQKHFAAGTLRSETLTGMYLKRIHEIDQNGPALHAVIEVNPDALTIARRMDQERRSGRVRGPLHGIPVLIKDNIDTADKMMTTAGSLALEGHHAAKDAFIVQQLRAAGAVILGKTNLSEWANFRSTRSSSGWSSRGGQTHNPYVLDRSPCGSSSGSAVAVAANLCVVAVGTETNGSIACPSSMNSVVGIKPTVGLVSRSGIIPISQTQDTAGPMARTVHDAAVLLGVLAGADPADPVTEQSAGKIKKDYTAFLNPLGLRARKIGVEKTMLKGHEAIDPLLQKALNQMRLQGATIVEVEFVKLANDLGKEESAVLEFEFKDGLDHYLATSNAPVRSLQDIINFNKRHEARAMPYFKQELMDSSQAKKGTDSREYQEVLNKLLTIRASLDKLFHDNQLDALCGPAAGLPWCIDLINGDSWTGYGAYAPAAVAGYPSITIPMGNVKELPVGISFLGPAYSEPTLIEIGYAYEQASKNRMVPRFRKTF